MGRRFLRAILTLPLRSVLQVQQRMLDSEADPPAKRPHNNLMAPRRIGTHNGTFHCDEALACALLRLLPEYRVQTSEPNPVPSDAAKA